jgi:hypothetical protein
MILMTPFFAVFMIDENPPVLSEFILAFAMIFGVSFGVCAVIFFPVAAIGEIFAGYTKHVIWTIPIGLGTVSISILIAHAVISRSVPDAILSWSGLIALLSGLFVFYWTILWCEKGIIRLSQKLKGLS